MRTYHGEKAIISLTSWKARIDTVSKTLFSLITMCPGFHIVLVLSEEEFPKKEAELPASLMAFVNNNLIELMWVYKNYRAFKKVLFTMNKYRDVPIISADDDFFYKWNYADALYHEYEKHRTCISCTTSNKLNHVWPHGYGTLYPPASLLQPDLDVFAVLDILVACHCVFDDGLLGRLYYRKKDNKPVRSLNLHWPDVCEIHTTDTQKVGVSKTTTKLHIQQEYRIMEHLLQWRP